MKNMLRNIALATTIGAGSAIAASPALAQLDLGVKVDPRVNVRVGNEPAPRTEVHHHYVYEGYSSGEWYPEHRVHRTHHWNSRYEGYDCYDAFRYDWEDGERVRYESTWCYDAKDRPYEARGTRVVVKID
ncbi:hypothetical protein [Hyphomonas jannaschiana]|uniref:hypothetical protein n=1 Tax=Hyphomonas jannaschiana TaxID=86 RepID=UPI0035C6760A